MTKVLIGNRNIQTDFKDFQFLKNDNEFELITSNTGKETIEICRSIKPNIIILDSNISDMAYPDIIDKISALPEEYDKCNLILTVNNPKDKQLLKHTSILYEIFDYPLDTNRAKQAINDLKQKYSKPNITISEIQHLLSALGINIYKLGSQCLASAIYKCYYHPEWFYTLDHIYQKVAEDFDLTFDLTKEEIKNKIRHSIDTLNTSNTSNNSLYVKIFGQLRSVSSKVFIQMFVDYLNIEKSKK